MYEPIKYADANTNKNAFSNVLSLGISETNRKCNKHHYKIDEGECHFVVQIDKISSYIVAVTFQPPYIFPFLKLNTEIINK